MQFAPLYPWIYRLLAPRFPDCLWSGSANDAGEPEIALSFDDGPHPDYTPQLLDVLAEAGVTASFFWLGACVRRYPAVARQVFERGHWLGLHGDSHRAFPRLSATELHASLTATQQAIAQACDLPEDWVRDRVRDVRPPNGLFTPQTLRWLHAWGYRPVMWSVVPEDWENPGVEVVCDRVLRQVRPGSLVVLHDGRYGGATVAETTRRLLPLLQQRTYRFVNVDRLWQRL